MNAFELEIPPRVDERPHCATDSSRDRRQVVSTRLHSLPPTMSRCLVCKLPIADNPIARRWRGERVEMHSECWHGIEAKHAENRAFAEARLAPVRSSLPKFTVSLGSSEFHRRVTIARLVAAATRYRPSEHGSLSILGESGVGKSTVVATIVDRLCVDAIEAFIGRERDTAKLEYAARIYWVTAADLCSVRRQHRLGEGEAPKLRRAEAASLLVLDEVGQEIADDRWLLELLDVRYASALATISTSGLTRGQIENRYGAGATRRLVEPKGQFLDLFRDAK